MPQTFNMEKLQAAILYACHQSTEDPWFGAVKLNKVLYYSDFIAYRQLGVPITGARYRKLREGPAPTELLQARQELVQRGKIKLSQREVFNWTQHRIIPLADLEPETLSPREIDIINEVLAFFRGKTASEVSEISHKEPGWILAKLDETIPYETAWLAAGPSDFEGDFEERSAGMTDAE